ncbi:MAG: hypothetical protein C0594_07760, partial [Marinilabiliales bacterium]
QAIQVLEEGLSFLPGNALLTYRIAAYEMKQDNMENAVFNLKKALKADKNLKKEFIKIVPDYMNHNKIAELLS